MNIVENTYPTTWAGQTAIAEYYSEAGQRFGSGPALKVCVSLVGDGALTCNGIEVQGNARVWLVWRQAAHLPDEWHYRDSTLWRADSYADGVTDNMRSKLIDAAKAAVTDDGLDVAVLWRHCEIDRIRRDLNTKREMLILIAKEVDRAEEALEYEIIKDPYTPWEATS